GAVDVQHHPERMSVQPGTFVLFWDVREPMSGLEGELLEYFQLRDPKVLVGLKAETPAGVLEAVLNGEGGVGLSIGPVHWLQEEVLETELLDIGRAQGRLGEYELELVALPKDQLGARLRAYADPVDVCGSFARPIGFYGDPEVAG